MPFLRIVAGGGITEEDFTKYLDAGAVAVSLGRYLYEDATSLTEVTNRAKAVRAKLDKYLEI